MEILEKYYPDEDYVFVYDNATTHLKRADGALSVSKMTKGPSSSFGVEVNVLGEDGKPVKDARGQFIKEKIHMENATLADGTSKE